MKNHSPINQPSLLRRLRFKKFTACLVLVCFTWQQILWAGGVPAPLTDLNSPPTPEVSVNQGNVSSADDLSETGLVDFLLEKSLNQNTETHTSTGTSINIETRISDLLGARPLKLRDGTSYTYSDDKKWIMTETIPHHDADGKALTSDVITYRQGKGGMSGITLGTGENMEYSEDAETGTLVLKETVDAEEIRITIPTSETTDSETIRTYKKLSNGTEVWFENGKAVEILTSEKIRITDFELTAENEFKYAWVQYQDGIREFVWKGKVLRRIYSGGLIQDFLPSGLLVREILNGKTQYYEYQKVSQERILRTKVISEDGALAVYDMQGFLIAAAGVDEQGRKEMFYYQKTRSRDEQGEFFWSLRLNQFELPENSEKNYVTEMKYSASGVVQEIRFKDQSRMVFEGGRISKVFDAEGVEQTSYEYLVQNGLPAGFEVKFQTSTLVFSSTGDLKDVRSEESTLRRIADLSDPSSMNLIIDLGEKGILYEFEVDEAGNILQGTLISPQGVKKEIRDGKVVSLQTTDGKYYTVEDKISTLSHWTLKDGTVITFKEKQIDAITLPDKTVISNLEVDDHKKIISFQKTFLDGSKVTYNQNGEAMEMFTPEIAGKLSRFETITFVKKDGGIEEIILQEKTEGGAKRIFSPDGVLQRIEKQGVVALFENGSIRTIKTTYGILENPKWDASGRLTGEIVFTSVPKLKTELADVPGRFFQIFGDVRQDSLQGALGDGGFRFDGAGDYLVLPDSEDWNFGTEDFTLELRVRFSDVRGVKNLITQGNSLDDRMQFMLAAGSLRFYMGTSDGRYLDIDREWNPEVNTWYQVALKRHGNTWQLFVEGQPLGKAATSEVVMPDFSSGLMIGKLAVEGAENNFHGWMDELKITKGASQLISDFNEYTRDDKTVLLLHFSSQEIETGTEWVPVSSEKDALDSAVEESSDPGMRLQVEHGSLSKIEFNDNSRLTYQNGQITQIETSEAVYKILRKLNTDGSLASLDVMIVKGGTTETHDLLIYLSDYPASILADILLSRLPRNLLSGGLEVLTSLNGNKLLYSKTAPDAERGTVWVVSDKVDLSFSLDNLTSREYQMGAVGKNTVLDAGDSLPAETAGIYDMDGDGLLDRVWVDRTFGFWWVQHNNGNGFDLAQKWENLDVIEIQTGSNSGNSRAMTAYEGRHPQSYVELIDMNGDGLPDRVFYKPGSEHGEWYVQLNNGNSFEQAVVWDGGIQLLSNPSSSGKYAMRARAEDPTGGKEVQELVADLVDLDGDGLVDRVVRPLKGLPELNPDFNYEWWYFQKNTGEGFAPAIPWKGVDTSAVKDPAIAGALEWYNSTEGIAELGRLSDMNGDGRPDRVFLKCLDPQNPESIMAWHVQINNGKDFDPAILWDTSVRALPGVSNQASAVSIRWFKDPNGVRGIYADLMDVTGDGFPDRVTLDSVSDQGGSTWWVEVNTGIACGDGGDQSNCGFRDAVAWTGIEGSISLERTISQDTTIYYSQSCQDTSRQYTPEESRSPGGFLVKTALRDINGDHIPDRILMNENGTAWNVQFGTGHGFLPSKEMALNGISIDLGKAAETLSDKTQTAEGVTQTSTAEIGSGSQLSLNTQTYEYLHISLKADRALSATDGEIIITLSDPLNPEASQEIRLTKLGTEWMDQYLKLDPSKASATQIQVRFEPASDSVQVPAVFVDNLMLTDFRSSDSNEWMDYLLTQEAVLAGIQNAPHQNLSSETLARFGTSPLGVDWNQILNAEVEIVTESSEETNKQTITSFSGTETTVENGAVTRTKLSDGSTITYTKPTEDAPNKTTQTMASEDSSHGSTTVLEYGRIRSVERPDKTLPDGTTVKQSPLEYRYETGDDGVEIMSIFDPDAKTTEQYLLLSDGSQRLVSRIDASQHTEKKFIYDETGELIRTDVYYREERSEVFQREVREDGTSTLISESGFVEEYDRDGNVIAYVTNDGYRYVFDQARARQVVIKPQTESFIPDDGELKKLYDEDPSKILQYFPDGKLPEYIRYLVSLEEDPEGEWVKTMVLESRIGANGEKIYYGRRNDKGEWTPDSYGELTKVQLKDGTEIEFSEFEIVKSKNSATGIETEEKVLKNAVVRLSDGTVIEFKNGFPIRVQSASGVVFDYFFENGEVVSGNLSSTYYASQAQALWDGTVLTQWKTWQLDSSRMAATEQTAVPSEDGKSETYQTVTRTFAGGGIELYDGKGRLFQTLSNEGEILAEYFYDDEGNPTGIDMSAARNRLELTVSGMRAEIAAKKALALEYVEDRQMVLNQTMEGEYAIIYQRLCTIREGLQKSREQLASVRVSGNQARNVLLDGYQKIDEAENQLNQAFSDAAKSREDSLNEIKENSREAVQELETETAQAYADLEEHRRTSLEAILKQECLPVIQHWYRKILGRDASRAEYDRLLGIESSVDAETGKILYKNGETVYLNSEGKFQTEALVQMLETSEEARARKEENEKIKDAVIARMQAWAGLSAEEQASRCVSEYGMEARACLSFNDSDAAAMEAWLGRQGMHFGQSAFLALEALLDLSTDHGLMSIELKTRRIEMAAFLIMADILTGTLTPFETEDLTISADALMLYAKVQAAKDQKKTPEITAYAMTYEAFREWFLTVCPAEAQEACQVEAVVLMSGNHYVVVRGIYFIYDENGNMVGEELEIQDVGVGPESAQEVIRLSKEAFLARWNNISANPHAAAANNQNSNLESGYVLLRNRDVQRAALNPESARVLDAKEARQVRGAFFGIDDLIIAIIYICITIVQAVVAAVVALIQAIVVAITSLISGIAGAISSLAAGNLLAAGQSLFGGILSAMGHLAVGFVNAAYAFGSTLANSWVGLQGAFSTMMNTGVMKITMVGLVLDGVGSVLEAVGVSPKVTRTLISAGEMIIGVALVATGNPLGYSLAVTGATGIITEYTELDPVVTNLIAIGAVALTGAALGGISGGVTGAIDALKTVAPGVAADLAGVGVSMAGNAMGLDPRLTALISIPIRMAVGGAVSHFTSPHTFTVIDPKTGDPLTLTDTRSFLDHVSDAVFSGTTMAGVVSVGADYVLDKVGAPDWTRDLTQGFISGFASSETGKKFFNWLGQGAQNFAGWVWNAGSAVVDFGAKMLEGAAEMTEAGFRKAIDFFAPAFNQQTQDELYREVKYGLKGTVSKEGDVWTWQGESTTITYNTKTGEATNTAGGSTMDIEGLGRGTNGEYGYKELNYKNVTEDGTYQRTYKDGKLVGYEYCTNSGMCVTANADPSTPGGILSNGTVIEGQVSVYIPGPDESNPPDQQDPTKPSNWFDSTTIDFNVHNGQETNVHVETSSKPGVDIPSTTTLPSLEDIIDNAMGRIYIEKEDPFLVVMQTLGEIPDPTTIEGTELKTLVLSKIPAEERIKIPADKLALFDNIASVTKDGDKITIKIKKPFEYAATGPDGKKTKLKIDSDLVIKVTQTENPKTVNLDFVGIQKPNKPGEIIPGSNEPLKVQAFFKWWAIKGFRIQQGADGYNYIYAKLIDGDHLLNPKKKENGNG